MIVKYREKDGTWFYQDNVSKVWRGVTTMLAVTCDGTHFPIRSDSDSGISEVFLLNDSGKTIERIRFQ